MTVARPRIGLIGSGLIAASRVPALRAAGLEVTMVASRGGSPRTATFAEAHGIGKVGPDWRALLARSAELDALVISTWPDGSPAVLEAAMPLGLPILVEKPVAWNTATHRRLLDLPHEHVMVGYNRRFYASVRRMRDLARTQGPAVATLTLPTAVRPPDALAPGGYYLREFYESVTALGLDLTRFILGDLQVRSVTRQHTPPGNLAGFGATLTSARGDLLQVTGNWGSAANYSLVLNWPDLRAELSPFEMATVYRGMEVLDPTEEYPIRRYVPRAVERVTLAGEDLRHKPGFHAEAMALRGMIAGAAPPEGTARLEDAWAVTHLCESLTGVALSDANPNAPV